MLLVLRARILDLLKAYVTGEAPLGHFDVDHKIVLRSSGVSELPALVNLTLPTRGRNRIDIYEERHLFISNRRVHVAPGPIFHLLCRLVFKKVPKQPARISKTDRRPDCRIRSVELRQNKKANLPVFPENSDPFGWQKSRNGRPF